MEIENDETCAVNSGSQSDAEPNVPGDEEPTVDISNDETPNVPAGGEPSMHVDVEQSKPDDPKPNVQPHVQPPEPRNQLLQAAESVAEEASELMLTDVVFTSRKSMDVQSNGADPLQQSNSQDSDATRGPSPNKSLSTQNSTDSGKKTAGTLSNLLGRLRGAPVATKSAGSPSSTTGLIFENRPSNLPAKSEAEEKKHRRQYEAMLAAAGQKKKKEEGQMVREANDRIKREEEESSRLSYWLKDVLPHWETMHGVRKTKDLWWCGLPTRVRGQVWKRALGNDLQITHDLFEISRARATEMIKLGVKTKSDDKETSSSTNSGESGSAYLVSAKSREASVQLIHLDVRRTFPLLGIFQEGGPLHKDLHDVLCAYSCYRPDMGYVQGMSFLAAVFILNMEPSDAFVCLANLLCKPIHMALFRMDATQISLYFNTFAILLDETLPKLASHFKTQGVEPATFLVEWFFTSFSKSLPLDVASRVWDVYFRDGDEFLYKTGLGILHLYQPRMLEMEFSDLAQFFTHLPDDINVDELFQSIAAINLPSKRYQQVLVQQKDKATASC
ncbi:TBC1 domain family member 12-like [Sycon ciliatum]|uniref:TBC1 domain family member 12-like n=1 Tax=Sycon ciliatum TaxID=27933 RepID=UPI0020AC2B7C|eukprot:scpid3936/ scgid33836/ TBC1 domain family member 12